MMNKIHKDNRGVLIVISGPSGAGKGTICKALLEKHDDIFISVSATTRNPRVGEVDGVNYHFLTKEEFKQRIAAVSYTHLTLPTSSERCRSRWSPYH